MQQYCYIDENGISQPQSLPRNWRNISNFNALEPAKLAEYGWFQFVPAIQPVFDPASQRVESQLHFDGVTVSQSWTVVALTQAEQVAYFQAIRPLFGGYLKEHMQLQVAFRGYDNIETACSWLASSVPQWVQDSQEANAFRDACYKVSEQIEDDVLAGTRTVPTREEFIAALPLLGWEPTPPPDNGNGTI